MSVVLPAPRKPGYNVDFCHKQPFFFSSAMAETIFSYIIGPYFSPKKSRVGRLSTAGAENFSDRILHTAFTVPL